MNNDFEKELQKIFHNITNREFIWKETIPFISQLFKLNKYRILTISSQPSNVLIYHDTIEIRRSFLWFYIEKNETNLLLIDKLINNKNVYIQQYDDDKKILFQNFPFYNCTERIYIDGDLKKFVDQEVNGYPHSTYLDPLTYKIVQERIIIQNQSCLYHYKNCFYVRVSTVNGRCAIEEVLDSINEISHSKNKI